MKLKSQRDFWSGLLFLVAGIAFAIGALNYPFGTHDRPGPGYFPFGLGLLLALLGALVLFKSLTIEVEGGDPIGRIAWQPLLLIVAAVALFGFTLPRVGMIVSLPLLIVMASVAGSRAGVRFRWKEVLATCIAVTFIAWMALVQAMKLAVPLWPA